MFRIPPLEYNLSHPHPRGQLFLIATFAVYRVYKVLTGLLQVATEGSELVPSLQSQFQPNETLLEGWWGTTYLPPLFRPSPPPCQPKDIGRGDTFRLTTSLFDYTVMSTLNSPPTNGTLQVQEQIRAEYKGQNFSSCYVNSARFEDRLVDQTQSVTVGVLCQGFPDYPIDVSMQTTMTFAWELSKDFIGQYYGPGLDLLNINDTNPLDYRRVVLAVLQVISTDSLTIMHGSHLSNAAAGSTIVLEIDPVTGAWKDSASTLTYVNGTRPDQYPAEATIYSASISNLLAVAIDAVYVDLGSNKFPNIFRNVTRLATQIKPNLPPPNINSSDWAEGSRTFHYGRLSSYQTWADTLLHGQPVTVGNLTGLPKETVMATTYLCPSYQVKPIRSLLSSVFIGSATMTLSVWGTWIFVTTFIARRITKPQVLCECEDCKKKRAAEEKKKKEEEKEREEAEAGGDSGTNQTGLMIGMIARFLSKMGIRGHSTPSNNQGDEERGNTGLVLPQSSRPNYLQDVRSDSYMSGSSIDTK